MKPGTVVKEFDMAGKHIVIRYPQWDDLDGLLSYVNMLSQEDTFVQLSGETITRESEIDYLTKVLKNVEIDSAIHLVAVVDGVLAANTSITKGSYRKKHVGLLAIAISAVFRDMKLGSTLMDELIREAPRIGITLVELTCLSNNSRAIHVYEKAGFSTGGRIPGAIHYHGTYVDEVYLYKHIGGLNHKGGA